VDHDGKGAGRRGVADRVGPAVGHEPQSRRAWRLVWELAGIVGVDPHGLTLRELCAMADGRLRERWNHTAAVLAMLANAHRDQRRRAEPFGVADFHPFEAPRREEPLKVDITVLRDVFVPRTEPKP
jgi:hypothetical protein